MSGDPTEEVIALFRSPPEQFIQARNVLALSLREQGQPEEAMSVKALRKPTVPAWALNQIAERDPQGIDLLLDAGAELRAAQQATLSSAQEPWRLRTASELRRQAVMRLARVASAVLEESGRTSSAHVDEVMTALETASIDAEAGDRLRTGTFERVPPAATGLGDVFGLTIVPTGEEAVEPAPGSTRAKAAPKKKAESPVAEQDVILKAEVSRLRRDRDAAARRLRTDRAAAERYAGERDTLKARLDKVQGKLKETEALLKSGEAETRAAEGALKRAEDRLERARGSG